MTKRGEWWRCWCRFLYIAIDGRTDNAQISILTDSLVVYSMVSFGNVKSSPFVFQDHGHSAAKSCSRKCTDARVDNKAVGILHYTARRPLLVLFEGLMNRLT